MMALTPKTAQYFNSYAHNDGALVKSLLQELIPLFKSCASTDFKYWIDREIFCGEDWDGKIKGKLNECDGGLLMVSPSFLASDYIRKVELPALLEKGCIPVGLKVFDLKSQLDPDLKPLQLYRHETPKRGLIFYSECSTRQQREAFAFNLYQKIRDRILLP